MYLQQCIIVLRVSSYVMHLHIYLWLASM